jgi:chaperone modulatory protein CbpM
MKPPLLDMTWLKAREAVTVTELSKVCAMSVAELEELVDYGALVPLCSAQPERIFSAACVMPLRTASQLRHDFVLDLFTVGVLLCYLSRIESLEQQLQALSAGSGSDGRTGQFSGSATNI